MEAQEPLRKRQSGGGQIGAMGASPFCVARGNRGRADRKVPMCGIYAKHRLRLGIARRFIRLVREFREQAGAPAAAPVPLQEIPPHHERASPDPKNRRAMPAPANPAASESQRARAPVPPKTESPSDFHYDPTDTYRINSYRRPGRQPERAARNIELHLEQQRWDGWGKQASAYLEARGAPPRV